MTMLQKAANWLKSLRSENGQGLIEYALIICLVVIVVGFTLIIFGQSIVSIFVFVYESIIGWCGCL